MARTPDPSFTAMVFEACDRVLGRLAVWAAGRGPDPSFTAMVFEACDRVLGLELTAGNSKV